MKFDMCLKKKKKNMHSMVTFSKYVVVLIHTYIHTYIYIYIFIFMGN